MRTIITKNGPVSEALAVKWVKQVAMALDHIHSKGHIHRDVKPENIIIDEEGNVKLLDLGIVSLKMKASTIIGT